jgi:hypothetical protein
MPTRDIQRKTPSIGALLLGFTFMVLVSGILTLAVWGVMELIP